jgi:hypothetical protein
MNNQISYKENPFLINIPDKDEYTFDEYINIQEQLKNKNIDSIIELLYPPKNNFYKLWDFKRRITRGINQKIIDISSNKLPTKNLYKIGDGGNGKNCIVCCTPFANLDDNTRLIASQQILKSLHHVNFNGYFYLFNGGFPNPTGTEMKYVGVPYSFKIFMMLEAYKKGFDKVIWLDSSCCAINNLQPLFDILYTHDTVLKLVNSSNYDAMLFHQTTDLLNQFTNTDIHNASYIMTIVFGLNLASENIRKLINDYYEMVKIGWSFFSIFPEEIVLSSLFNKPEYKSMLNHNNSLFINERELSEEHAITNKYYFHHKDYSKYEKKYYITFDDTGGRFANQLYRYVICKLFTIKFGHTYISRNEITDNNYIIIGEDNINEILNSNPSNNILLRGYFQKSDLFIKYRQELMSLIYNNNNNDYWQVNNQNFYIKDYLINSKHQVNLKSNDIVISVRLDDFIQYPCKTSDIIPPEYYLEILQKLNVKDQQIYIVCDKIKYDWEFKYIEFFNKWNPIIIQASLIHDIALIRDCNIYIHSNSSLSWIISFLSNKSLRIIPRTPINPNQILNTIGEKDILYKVTPLDHDEVHNLDVNKNSIYPLSFCIPDECIVDKIPEKSWLLAPLIPGVLSTYIYKDKETEYNKMYRQSRFALTKMKGGWDCLRHYEILMNGCIPLFENLNDCPKYTLTTYPKELNDEAYDLYHKWCENDEFIEKYNILCNKYLEHTRNHCTTSATTKYFLSKIKDGNKVKNILLLTCHEGVNYNRESLWIGLKRYLKSIGGTAVEYPKIPFLYNDYDKSSSFFTYPNRLDKDDNYNMPENEIIDKINSNFWDLIIYGKVGPDEYCTFPYYNMVKSKYNKNKIVFLYGGDEIFNMKITDSNTYHINMFNCPIYYKPYVDYLNYYKQYGICFVRELEQ